jgi:hypothetical protein
MDTYYPLHSRLKVVIHKIINQPFDTWYIMRLYGKMLCILNVWTCFGNETKEMKLPSSLLGHDFQVQTLTSNSRCWCKVMELGRGIYVPQIVFWISNNIISWRHMPKTFENRAWNTKGQMELYIGTKFDTK